MRTRIHSQLQQFNGHYDPILVQQLVKSLYGVSKGNCLDSHATNAHFQALTLFFLIEFVGMNPRLFSQFIPVLLPSRGIEQELRELGAFFARVRGVCVCVCVCTYV